MIDDIDRIAADAGGRIAAAATLDELRALETELLGQAVARSAGLKQRLGALDPDERQAAGQAAQRGPARPSSARSSRAPGRARPPTSAAPGSTPSGSTSPRSPAGRRARPPPPRHPDHASASRTCSSAWASPSPRAPRSRPTGTTSRPSTCPPTTRPAACGTRSTSTSASPAASLLRTHTSPVQIRVMQAQRAADLHRSMPGPGVPAATPPTPRHLPVFHQIEGLVVDRGITFADLAGTIEAFTKAYFGGDYPRRACGPSYFPFTEPSAEFDIQRPDGSWLELGGCGMVHPNVLAQRAASTPRSGPGFAFGFGIDRLAADAPRRRRPPRAVHQRHPLPGAVLMRRSCCPGCASSRPFERDADALADALSDLGTGRSRRSSAVGEPARRRRRRRGARAAAASRRRPHPAGRRRRRRRRGAADLLRRLQHGGRRPRAAGHARHRRCPTAWRSPGARCGASGRTACSARPTSSASATTTAASSSCRRTCRSARPCSRRSASSADVALRPRAQPATGPTPVGRRAWPATWPPASACRFTDPSPPVVEPSRPSRRRRRSRSSTPTRCGRFTATVLTGVEVGAVAAVDGRAARPRPACGRSTTWSTSPTT